MDGVKGAVKGFITGAVIGAGGKLALASAHGEQGQKGVVDLATAGVVGGLTGAYVGFVGGMSKKDPLPNMAAAVWHVGKAFSASMVSLGVILPMQACVTAAIIGMMTHANGGVPPTPAQVLMIKTACDGVAFDAAARSGGLLAGSVQAIGAILEKCFAKCGIPIRTPVAPVGAAMGPDIGGLCFAIILGARAASSALYSYEHKGARPITPSTPFNADWRDLSSAIAAGIGVMATITLTTIMHRESKFAAIPPSKPLDLMISRSNAIPDTPGFAATQLLFGARALAGPGGIVEFAGGGRKSVAATSAMIFGPGIYILSSEYLKEGQLNDKGVPGRGAENPLLALRGLRDSKVAIPLRTLEARLAPALSKRMQPQSEIGLSQHLAASLRVGYSVLLTVLCVGLALRAAQGDDQGHFAVRQDDIDHMLDQHIGLKAGAGALAVALQFAGTRLMHWALTRHDPDARRAVAAWVGSMIAAIDTASQALGAPSFLTSVSVATAAEAVVEELVVRFRHRADPSSAYPQPDGKLDPKFSQVTDLIGKEVRLPGTLDRFMSYFRLAWDGMPSADALADPAAQPLNQVVPHSSVPESIELTSPSAMSDRKAHGKDDDLPTLGVATPIKKSEFETPVKSREPMPLPSMLEYGDESPSSRGGVRPIDQDMPLHSVMLHTPSKNPPRD